MVGNRMSGKWNDLNDEVKVAGQGKGRTADNAERDKSRRRPRMASEDRRVRRKITPTLSLDLIQQLREICKEEGYVGKDGEGTIASPVIEGLLSAAVQAYNAGLIKKVEVVEVRQELQWAGPGDQQPVPDASQMRRYLRTSPEQS